MYYLVSCRELVGDALAAAGDADAGDAVRARGTALWFDRAAEAFDVGVGPRFEGAKCTSAPSSEGRR